MVDGTNPLIVKEDVLQVAKRLNMKPTEEQIQQVIDEHEFACEQDPSATWNLVVEQQLYDILK